MNEGSIGGLELTESFEDGRAVALSCTLFGKDPPRHWVRGLLCFKKLRFDSCILHAQNKISTCV